MYADGGGGGAGYDLNALNAITTLAAYLFLNLVWAAAHHFDYHRVFLLVVYLVTYFSRSQNSTPHRVIENSVLFFFALLLDDQ
jgi:hypothetical protein